MLATMESSFVEIESSACIQLKSRIAWEMLSPLKADNLQTGAAVENLEINSYE